MDEDDGGWIWPADEGGERVQHGVDADDGGDCGYAERALRLYAGGEIVEDVAAVCTGRDADAVADVYLYLSGDE